MVVKTRTSEGEEEEMKPSWEKAMQQHGGGREWEMEKRRSREGNHRIMEKLGRRPTTMSRNQDLAMTGLPPPKTGSRKIREMGRRYACATSAASRWLGDQGLASRAWIEMLLIRSSLSIGLVLIRVKPMLR